MSGPWFTELENNHHYILVNERTGRSYYTPAQDDANEIAGILNRLEKIKRPVIFEIEREMKDGRTCHVAFVNDENIASEFCDKHKDCNYGPIPITKYNLHLEAQRCDVPCCETCIYHKLAVVNKDKKLTDEPLVMGKVTSYKEYAHYCEEYRCIVHQEDYCEKWEKEL